MTQLPTSPETETLLLAQAGYVLKNLHAERPGCGYDKLAEACSRAVAPTPLAQQPQYIVEGIILRRLHEKRIEGYTIETAKEIVEALSHSSTLCTSGEGK